MKIIPVQPIYRIPAKLPKKTKEERIEEAKREQLKKQQSTSTIDIKI